MKVMTIKESKVVGSYKYDLMGVDDEITHIHIDNIKNNKNSVIVPIQVLADLFHDNSC